MPARLTALLLCVLFSCDALGESFGSGNAPPLAPSLVAACPESAERDRSGSGQCPAVGCLNGFSLALSPTSGWAGGAYRFELSVDGRAVVCQGSLPLRACGEQSFSCDADGVRLADSGCALPADQQGISGITFDGFPLALSVRVQRDDQELASVELTPEYKVSQPNGPGCEPVCCSSSGELAIEM